MRAKTAEREQAIALRKRGLSYSEIRAQVPVSPASLSVWLRHIELTWDHQERLAQRKLLGQRYAAHKVHEDKIARVAEIRQRARRDAAEFLNREEMLWLAGVTLYWAEGEKLKEWADARHVSLTNMDPHMLRVFRRWLTRYGGIRSTDLDYALYIHENADASGARNFWAEEFGIEPSRLHVYHKKHNPSPRRKNIGRTYHGTMRTTVARSTALLYRTDEWIRATVAYCGVG